jgi:hypothetical protein
MRNGSERSFDRSDRSAASATLAGGGWLVCVVHLRDYRFGYVTQSVR